jgi:hypothetical protein
LVRELKLVIRGFFKLVRRRFKEVRKGEVTAEVGEEGGESLSW